MNNESIIRNLTPEQTRLIIKAMNWGAVRIAAEMGTRVQYVSDTIAKRQRYKNVEEFIEKRILKVYVAKVKKWYPSIDPLQFLPLNM